MYGLETIIALNSKPVAFTATPKPEVPPAHEKQLTLADYSRPKEYNRRTIAI